MPFYTVETLPRLTAGAIPEAPVLQGQHLTAVALRPQPGNAVPVHTHAQETLGIVIDGYVDIEIAGEAQRVEKGGFYHIPPGVPHGAAGGDGLVVEVFGPPRDDVR